jgi:hypothetical protein
MKKITTTTVPHLQKAARRASRAIDNMVEFLYAEIAARTEDDPDRRSILNPKPKKRPERVAYSTDAIDRLAQELLVSRDLLTWFSTHGDERGRLNKPRGLS